MDTDDIDHHIDTYPKIFQQQKRTVFLFQTSVEKRTRGETRGVERPVQLTNVRGNGGQRKCLLIMHVVHRGRQTILSVNLASLRYKAFT